MWEQKQSIFFLLVALIHPEVQLRFRLRLLRSHPRPLKNQFSMGYQLTGDPRTIRFDNPHKQLTLNCRNNSIQISYFFFQLFKWVRPVLNFGPVQLAETVRPGQFDRDSLTGTVPPGRTQSWIFSLRSKFSFRKNEASFLSSVSSVFISISIWASLKTTFTFSKNHFKWLSIIRHIQLTTLQMIFKQPSSIERYGELRWATTRTVWVVLRGALVR